jgi:hypothetical protein
MEPSFLLSDPPAFSAMSMNGWRPGSYANGFGMRRMTRMHLDIRVIAVFPVYQMRLNIYQKIWI